MLDLTGDHTCVKAPLQAGEGNCLEALAQQEQQECGTLSPPTSGKTAS